jgi:hypothetical protein
MYLNILYLNKINKNKYTRYKIFHLNAARCLDKHLNYVLSADLLIVSMRVLRCVMPRGGVPINKNSHTHSVNKGSCTWDCTLRPHSH